MKTNIKSKTNEDLKRMLFINARACNRTVANIIIMNELDRRHNKRK